MSTDNPVLVFSNQELDGLQEFKLYDGCYFISSLKTVGTNFGGSNYLVDHSGSGIFKDQFVMTTNDLLKLLENESFTISADEIGRQLRGSLSLYLVNKSEKKAMILPDPLGGSIIFYYQSTSLTMFSSNINSLIRVLNKIGIYPEKTIDYLSEIIGTGNGGFFESSYKDIHALRPFQYVDGIKEHFSIKDYNWKNEFFSTDKEYNELIDLAVEEIKNNITAVTNHQGATYKIAHLTGGFDSRLVLAGILSTNSSQFYNFFCSGRSNMPDRYTAERLSSEFGLTMTEYSGFNSIKSLDTLEDKFLLPMKYSGGIISALPHEFYEHGSNIILSGGYGECLRSFYESRITAQGRDDINSLMIELWGNTFFSNNDEESFFSANFKKRLSQKMELFFKECKELGLREDAYLDYMYLRIRNRYYVGVVSHNWSNFGARFDPLYSLNAFKCALSLPKDLRSANIVGLDIMNKLNSDLANLPFEKEVYNETYIKLRGKAQIRDFSNNNRPEFSLQELVNPINEIKPNNALPVHIEKAKKLKAPLWQVVELKAVQKQCLEYLSGMKSKEIETVFNKKILLRLLKSELNNRVHIRTVFSIYSLLLWYFSDETVTGGEK